VWDCALNELKDIDLARIGLKLEVRGYKQTKGTSPDVTNPQKSLMNARIHQHPLRRPTELFRIAITKHVAI
jgi:hypothetical protein